MNTALQCPRCGAPLPPPTTLRFACGYCRGELAITAVDAFAPAPPPRTLRLHDCGRSKIDAIRVIREITGFGLAESKALSEQTPPIDLPVRVDDATLTRSLDALRPLGARWECVDAGAQRVAGVGGAVTATASAPEIELIGCGRNRIAVIAAVHEVTGLGLAQSKDLCDRAPSRLRPVVKFTVEQAAQKLAAAGATVRVVR